MRYAILSDIHGNLLALNAVLGDIAAQAVDAILFAGDAFGEVDAANETVDTLRALAGQGALRAVRGNREGYLEALSRQDPAGWTYRQFRILYWNYRTLTDENRQFLMNLPPRLTLANPGCPKIQLAHAPAAFFGKTALDLLSGVAYAAHYIEWSHTHADYLSHAEALIKGDEDTMAALDAQPDGVYVFAHYHTQWHARIGGKLLINPGSCGLPSDLQTTAPYTLLTVDASGALAEERRVPYDVESAVGRFKASGLYGPKDLWSTFTVHQIRTGEMLQIAFLESVARLSLETGGTGEAPFENDLWAQAEARWIAAHGIAH